MCISIYISIYIYRWEIFHQDGADYPGIIGPEAARSPPTTPGMVPAGGSVRGMGMMGWAFIASMIYIYI